LSADVRGGSYRDLARARGQDEAQRISSGIERGARVIEVCRGANLDPEHNYSFEFRAPSFKFFFIP
jgi:hypothetical protein